MKRSKELSSLEKDAVVKNALAVNKESLYKIEQRMLYLQASLIKEKDHRACLQSFIIDLLERGLEALKDAENGIGGE